jgi:hypothetical protein
MLDRIRAALGRMWRHGVAGLPSRGPMTSVPVAGIARSKTSMRPEG